MTSKTTLNSLEEVLNEINTLIAQKEKEDYAKIFLKRGNLNITYQSNEYLEIMNISATHSMRANAWNVDFDF
jgi:hypothetical protein